AFPLMINGATAGKQPLNFTARTGRVRLRFINASIADIITISRADKRPLVQVATESAFLTGPLRMDEVRIVAGRRPEVVVDVADAVVTTAPPHPAPGRGGSATPPVIRLKSGSDWAPPPLPARLNVIPRYDVRGIKPRVIRLTQDGLMGINGV